MYDIGIIGAGVVGAAIARELSKYDLKVCLIEKDEDVSMGASKANSGIVHGGYVGKYGTEKGELCIKGNSMFERLDRELNFGFKRTGAIVIGFDKDDEEKIHELYENAIKVGHKKDDIGIIYSDKIKEIEPHINDEVKVAFYCKSVGVTSPYEMTIALVENAIQNGIDLKLETEVLNIGQKSEGFVIETNRGNIATKYIINAAGIYSDKIANMVGIDKFKILPRRGQYVLFGKDQGHLVNTVVFQTPTKKGKGILVTTTYHGNFMLGPDAEDINEREDIDTTIDALEYVVETARKSIPNFNIKRALTTFSGIRARSSTGDFIIQESDVRGFINVAGIDSPGLTSSPAIAEKVIGILKDAGVKMEKKDKFDSYRAPIIVKKDGFKGKIDHHDPEKNIICRCEKVTEAEIVDAIHRGVPIKSTDAIKRRTRAGMGNCQGAFCRPRVKNLISREEGIGVDQVTVRGAKASPIPQRVDIKDIRKIEK